MKKGGLGKGLEAIFAENDVEDRNASVALKISEIEPNRGQPRKEFDDAALAELADSISRHGILQPLLVRPLPGGGYQIVAGERRWRAARMAGLSEVPALIRELTDAEVMQLALIENLQREDLSPLEEAAGYRALMETHGFTQEEVAQAVGKSRPAVANALRLLQLPDEVRTMLDAGQLSAGHARALLSLPSPELQAAYARRVAKEGLSVRELEALVKRLNKGPHTQRPRRRSQYYDEVQLAVGNYLGRKVQVRGTPTRGSLQIEFYGEEDLNSLLEALRLRG